MFASSVAGALLAPGSVSGVPTTLRSIKLAIWSERIAEHVSENMAGILAEARRKAMARAPGTLELERIAGDARPLVAAFARELDHHVALENLWLGQRPVDGIDRPDRHTVGAQQCDPFSRRPWS